MILASLRASWFQITRSWLASSFVKWISAIQRLCLAGTGKRRKQKRESASRAGDTSSGSSPWRQVWRALGSKHAAGYSGASREEICRYVALSPRSHQASGQWLLTDAQSYTRPATDCRCTRHQCYFRVLAQHSDWVEASKVRHSAKSLQKVTPYIPICDVPTGPLHPWSCRRIWLGPGFLIGRENLSFALKPLPFALVDWPHVSTRATNSVLRHNTWDHCPTSRSDCDQINPTRHKPGAIIASSLLPGSDFVWIIRVDMIGASRLDLRTESCLVGYY
jgi:hypothetical protein